MSNTETILQDTNSYLKDLNPNQIKSFRKCKRSLLRSFLSPNYAIKALIDVVALEYVRYMETKSNVHVKNIKEILNELDLTPKSKRAVDVETTLSKILSSLGD